MSRTIFGMNLAVKAVRAGMGSLRRIGPMISPTNRSTAVHRPPPTTWQKVSAHSQLPAMDAMTNTTTTATIGSPRSGTTWGGLGGGPCATSRVSAGRRPTSVIRLPSRSRLNACALVGQNERVSTPEPADFLARLRPRRSCLAVPGSNPRFLEKAQTLPADEVFLDLEDAVAPLVKERARHAVVEALNGGLWVGKTCAVRVNDWTTHWTYRDVITVVEGAGANLDCVILPKVADAGQVTALDLLLTQVEKAAGLPAGRIGIEAQIENAAGLMNVEAIAAASPRLETIIFGPADFMASINMRSLVVGEQPPGYPADAYHYVLMRILIAARAHGLQAIDGPYLQVRSVDGFREVARRAAALGFDGKWVLHPDQIAAANEIFSPAQEDYDHAELILDAYDWSVSAVGGARGAAMLGDEMIDEASRKMALVIAAQGRAAGLRRTSVFEPPQE